MLTVPKIIAAIYAIRKHYSRDSYQLLQNPKGVTGEVVHLIKCDHYINPKNLDIYESNTSITKDFSKTNPKIYKKTFEKIIYRFFDHNFNVKEERIFRKYIKKNPKGVNEDVIIRGERLSGTDDKKRNTAHLKNKTILIEDSYPDPSFMPQEHPYLYSVHRYISFAENEIKQFYLKSFIIPHYFPDGRKSFWQTLRYNLSK